jgi:hypothetical protein
LRTSYTAGRQTRDCISSVYRLIFLLSCYPVKPKSQIAIYISTSSVSLCPVWVARIDVSLGYTFLFYDPNVIRTFCQNGKTSTTFPCPDLQSVNYPEKLISDHFIRARLVTEWKAKKRHELRKKNDKFLEYLACLWRVCVGKLLDQVSEITEGQH